MKGNKDVMKVVPLFFFALNCINPKSSWGGPSRPEKEGIMVKMHCLAITNNDKADFYIS